MMAIARLIFGSGTCPMMAARRGKKPANQNMQAAGDDVLRTIGIKKRKAARDRSQSGFPVYCLD